MKRICLIFTLTMMASGCTTKRAALKHGEKMYDLGRSAGKVEESIECLSRFLKSKCPEALIECEGSLVNCQSSKSEAGK